MSKRMSDVRSYVGGYRRRVYVKAGILKEKAGKDEKHTQHPGMCKGMKGMAGYVAGGG